MILWWPLYDIVMSGTNIWAYLPFIQLTKELLTKNVIFFQSLLKLQRNTITLKQDIRRVTSRRVRARGHVARLIVYKYLRASDGVKH